jgi:hypothetical protein
MYTDFDPKLFWKNHSFNFRDIRQASPSQPCEERQPEHISPLISNDVRCHPCGGSRSHSDGTGFVADVAGSPQELDRRLLSDSSHRTSTDSSLSLSDLPFSSPLQSTPAQAISTQPSLPRNELTRRTCLIVPSRHWFCKHHAKRHKTRPHKCPRADCQYHDTGFALRKDLDRHEATVHTGDQLQRRFCPHRSCKYARGMPANGFPLARGDNYIRHLKSKHSDIQNQDENYEPSADDLH